MEWLWDAVIRRSRKSALRVIGGEMNEDVIQYDRTNRPLEFWAATLAANCHPCTLTEDDLEAVISMAMRYSCETGSATVKCLAHYVLGKCILLLRIYYPNWREWVAHTAMLVGEWAHESGDPLLVRRSESLYEEYFRALRQA